MPDDTALLAESHSAEIPEFVTHAQYAPSVMLTERDQRIIEFERSWWQHAGAKDHAIRETLSMSATRYYQALRRLINDPEAEAFDPLTIRRLRKVRAEARQRRVERRLHRLGET